MADFTYGLMFNLASTTLLQEMTALVPANGGTLQVDDVTVFSTKGYALVGSELLHYDSVTSTGIVLNTVDGRGSGGTTPAAHAISSTIYADVRVAAHINELVASSPGTLFSAKGQLMTSSGANIPTALNVGTDGQTLYADSTQASGLKWNTAPVLAGMTLISDTLLAAPAATIDIQNIPQTYRHLLLKASVICASGVSAGYYLNCRVNNDSGTNYDSVEAAFYDTVSTVTFEEIGSANGLDLGLVTDLGASPATYANPLTAYFPDYTSATKNKSFFSRGFYSWADTAKNRSLELFSGLWHNTSAITRLTLGFFGDGSQFAAGSRVSLYGLV